MRFPKTKTIERDAASTGAVTTQDVARLAGVSRATVSFVLNGQAQGRVSPDTNARVLSAAETLGYRRNRLATALSTGRTHTIGIVSEIRDFQDVALNTPLYLKNLLLAVTLAAARTGLSSTLLLETLDVELKPDDVLDGRVDGIVVCRMHENPHWVRRVTELGLPCVEIGSHWGSLSVEADHAGGAQLATQHLIDLGHRRIVFFLGHASFAMGPAAELRREAFLQTTARAGIPMADCPVARIASELKELLSADTASKRRPTAVFAFSDTVALEASDVIADCGLRIPGDVSLVGFDNDQRAETMRPLLTTVINPIDELAEKAVALLRRQIAGEISGDESVTVPTTLVIRDSTQRISSTL